MQFSNIRLVEIQQLLSVMQYQQTNKWFSIPDWACELVTLGFEFAVESYQSQRILALVVPTREMAAAFFGVGLVLGRIFGDTDGKNDFEAFWQLEESTSVKLIIGGVHTGVIQSKTFNASGIREVRVKIDKKRDGSGTELRINEKMKFDFSLPESRVRLRKDASISTEKTSFFEHIAHLLKPTFVPSSKLDCLFVGEKNTLKLAAELVVRVSDTSNSFLMGCLLDVLRPKSVVDVGTVYRCNFLSSRSNDDFEVMNELTSIIFDGSTEFLHCVDQFPKHNWVVILEQSDSQFQAAVDRLNSDFIRRSEDWKPVTQIQGVEMLSFLGEQYGS
jgi:hypothetical protein